MSSFDDLGRALRDDAAANAPRASAIDVDAVALAARARRRPRQWAVGTLSVVAALGMGGLALQAVTPPALIVASESAGTATAESAGGADLLSEPGAPEALGDGERSLALLPCGAAAPQPFAHSALTFSVQVPSSARAADGDIVGVAVLTNSSSDLITITTRAEASGSLSDGGIVASKALDAPEAVQTVEIASGDRFEFPLRVSTAACGGDTLGPGVFSVFSALEVVVQPTGQSVVLVSNPLTVRLD
jgi:hypothetical protein